MPMIRSTRALPLAGCLLAMTLLAGCGADEPQTAVTTAVIPAAAASAVVSSVTAPLRPAELAAVTDATPDGGYKLGPDDTIAVSVYDHPELTVPLPGSSGNLNGALITADGTVQLPMIGSIHLGGLTLAEAQTAITNAYANYIQDPQVAVQLSNAQSFRYYLLGAFTSPGVKYPMHSLTLLEALSLGGSVDMAHADLYQAYVSRNGVRLPEDLHALLVDGDMSQNMYLASGDSIVVPTADDESAFVIGAVLKPGPVPFHSGALTLLQALSASQMDLTNYEAARLQDVRVIRTEGDHAALMVVNAAMILQGNAAPFPLRPGDVVFVAPTKLASWGAVMNEILPSLQAVSATLNPFVDIKYLQQKTN